jgi:hypothetical protein
MGNSINTCTFFLFFLRNTPPAFSCAISKNLQGMGKWARKVFLSVTHELSAPALRLRCDALRYAVVSKILGLVEHVCFCYLLLKMSKCQIYEDSKNECDSCDEVENLGSTWDVGTWLRCASGREVWCINTCLDGSLNSQHNSPLSLDMSKMSNGRRHDFVLCLPVVFQK